MRVLKVSIYFGVLKVKNLFKFCEELPLYIYIVSEYICM